MMMKNHVSQEDDANERLVGGRRRQVCDDDQQDSLGQQCRHSKVHLNFPRSIPMGRVSDKSETFSVLSGPEEPAVKNPVTATTDMIKFGRTSVQT